MVGDVVSAWKIEMAEEVQLSIDGWEELILLSHCGEGRSYSTLFPIRHFKIDRTSDGLPDRADARLAV
jgi:hypothetical protein